MTSHTGPTVLVVEDDRATREMYRSAFKSAGYSVVAVEDGTDALRVLERELPNAVVLDLALPRLGGRDVLRDLKARPDTQRIPIVIVTGGETNDIAPDIGVSVLSKPIHPEAVVWEVEKSISRVRRQQGAAG